MRETHFRPGVLIQWVLLVLALALGGGVLHAAEPADRAGTEKLVPKLDPNFTSTSHKLVLITDAGVNPETVELAQNELVAWISYSQSPSSIVFNREVARDMICHSMVNFSLQKDELRSEPIDPGEFASFCQLRPGTYPYQVFRERSAGEKVKPLPVLKGAIVVRESE